MITLYNPYICLAVTTVIPADVQPDGGIILGKSQDSSELQLLEG